MLFVCEFALQIPLPSHFATTTDVSQGNHKPTLEQTQALAHKSDTQIRPIGAIANQQRRRIPITHHVVAAHNRQGDLGAVAARHKDPLEDVVCWIMPSTTHHILFDGGIDATL